MLLRDDDLNIPTFRLNIRELGLSAYCILTDVLPRYWNISLTLTNDVPCLWACSCRMAWLLVAHTNGASLTSRLACVSRSLLQQLTEIVLWQLFVEPWELAIAVAENDFPLVLLCAAIRMQSILLHAALLAVDSSWQKESATLRRHMSIRRAVSSCEKWSEREVSYRSYIGSHSRQLTALAFWCQSMKRLAIRIQRDCSLLSKSRKISRLIEQEFAEFSTRNTWRY